MNQTILSLFDTYEDLIELQQEIISLKGMNGQYRNFLDEERKGLISVLQKYKNKLDDLYLGLN